MAKRPAGRLTTTRSPDHPGTRLGNNGKGPLPSSPRDAQRDALCEPTAWEIAHPFPTSGRREK